MGLCAAAFVSLGPKALALDLATAVESKARALFLANFGKYVQWPECALDHGDAPVVIGVLGHSEVEKELINLAKTTRVGGRPLAIKKFDADSNLTGCHILFVPSVQTAKWDYLLAGLGCSPTLTASDGENFLLVGGMIELVRRDSQIRPEVNLAAVNRAGLKLSSKLLAVSSVRRNLPPLVSPGVR